MCNQSQALPNGDALTSNRFNGSVIDGYSFPHASKRVNIAGHHITSYLIEPLLRRGYALNRTSDFETAREI